MNFPWSSMGINIISFFLSILQMDAKKYHSKFFIKNLLDYSAVWFRFQNLLDSKFPIVPGSVNFRVDFKKIGIQLQSFFCIYFLTVVFWRTVFAKIEVRRPWPCLYLEILHHLQIFRASHALWYPEPHSKLDAGVRTWFLDWLNVELNAPGVFNSLAHL